MKRQGFLAATAYGLFGTLTALVVCAAGVSVYGLHIVNAKADRVLDAGAGIVSVLPQLQESLPPALSDMLNDRRTPSYREQVELQCRLVGSTATRRYDHVVIEVANNGPDTITLMALRVVLIDEDGVPVRAMSTYAATPATIENDWRGPLLPGSTRQCAFTLYGVDEKLRAEVEITDLRVWVESEHADSGDRQAVSLSDSM